MRSSCEDYTGLTRPILPSIAHAEWLELSNQFLRDTLPPDLRLFRSVQEAFWDVTFQSGVSPIDWSSWLRREEGGIVESRSE